MEQQPCASRALYGTRSYLSQISLPTLRDRHHRYPFGARLLRSNGQSGLKRRQGEGHFSGRMMIKPLQRDQKYARFICISWSGLRCCPIESLWYSDDVGG